MTLPQLIKEGEKEFDEKFGKPANRKIVECLTDSHIYFDNTDLKSHIRQDKLKLIDWIIEEMPKELGGHRDELWRYYAGGHDTFRQQILSLLEEVKKELKK